MTESKLMTVGELQEKYNISVEKFKEEILQICLKPEYSNDVVRDGLDFTLNFIMKEIYKARRENFESIKDRIA